MTNDRISPRNTIENTNNNTFEHIANQIKTIPTTKKHTIFVSELNLQEIREQAALYPDVQSTITFNLNQLKTSGVMKSLSNLEQADLLLARVAISTSIPMAQKNSFFKKIKGISEKNLAMRSKELIQEPTSTPAPLPVQAAFVLNSKATRDRIQKLRDIKKAVKQIPSLDEISKQYKSLYQEYINTLIAQTKIDTIIVDEQPGKGVRVGDTYSPKREHTTRRLTVFGGIHLQENQQNISTREGKAVLNLPEITTTHISSSIDVEIPQNLLTFQHIQVSEHDHQFFSIVFTNVLNELGLLSSQEDSQKQIEAYETGDPTIVPDIATFTILVTDRNTLAVNSKYNIILIPKDRKDALVNATALEAHEMVHVIQAIARSQSKFPGLDVLSSLGRSSVLAEAGAIKVETMVKSLFNKNRPVGHYHLQMIQDIENGKNYWEVLRGAYNSIVNQNELSIDEALPLAIRRVNRAYSNLGATGDNSSESRFTTSITPLAYYYQADPKYNAIPYHLSGIPLHRYQEFFNIDNPTKSTIPIPTTNKGVPISEEYLINVVIQEVEKLLPKIINSLENI